MKKNPVVVFVADEKRSQEFMNNSNLVTFGADTMYKALAQVIFSYPDVVVIDASDDMLRAEDTFFHLRTINHPPIIMLSNLRQRWYTGGKNDVIVMSEYSATHEIEDAIRSIVADKKLRAEHSKYALLKRIWS